MSEALTFVENTVRSAHVGSRSGLSARTERALSDARERIAAPQSHEAFYFILNGFLRTLDDAHTVVRLHAPEACDYLDLPLYWNDDGLLLTAKTAALERGDKLVRIGGLDEADVLEKLRIVVPAENEYYLRARGAALMPRADYLRYLGVLDEDGGTEIEVVSHDGSRRSVSLHLERGRPEREVRGWVGYELYPDDSLGLFWFDRFEYDAEMAETMAAFFSEVANRHLTKIAVDLRGNPGGDSSVAFAFLEYFADVEYRSFSVEVRVSEELEHKAPHFSVDAMNQVLRQSRLDPLPADTSHYRLDANLVKQFVLARLTPIPAGSKIELADRRLFLITDGGTFSSGNLFATLVKDNELGAIVGEPTGNRVNFNGSELRFDVPHTDMYLNLSTAKMIRPATGRGDSRAIQPDYKTPLTRDALISNVDPALEFIKRVP